VQKRRTFAIISHPDAGKTTLTEKFLLLGGAIRLAGSVKAKKSKKFATSDWMELEKQRGISVSTSVMNFEYKNYVCNLLDTPGHQDFSEDTFRTLAAVDSAIMLLDGAKGVEPQTIQLFEVCKRRKIPIFTFINKMDRDARDPLELLENIEQVLGIKTYPMTWPIGSGSLFRGVVERSSSTVHVFEGRNTSLEAFPEIIDLNDKNHLFRKISEDQWEPVQESLAMQDMAGNGFDQQEFLQGQLTPVFFGSAMTNFGVRAFLEAFLQRALPPGPKFNPLGEGSWVQPLSKEFSGFVFKIQANMDPRHRDRMAFLRVVSGTYQPGQMVHHQRLNREIKLPMPQQFFAQERTQMDKAYAGDIVGIYDVGNYAIGDTLSQNPSITFETIPSFAPEHFRSVRLESALKRKQLLKGLVQLCQEGTVQMFVDEWRAASDPILAGVGTLQFDVLLFRLQNEYGLDCSLEPLPFKYARWCRQDLATLEEARKKTDATLVKDVNGDTLFLFKNQFQLDYFQETFPTLTLSSMNL